MESKLLILIIIVSLLYCINGIIVDLFIVPLQSIGYKFLYYIAFSIFLFGTLFIYYNFNSPKDVSS